MTRRRTPPALLAALAGALGLHLSACASTPEETRDPEPGAVRTGDDLMRAGDFDGAARAYDREGAATGSPVAREKLRNAKTRGAAAHAAAALRAASAGDIDRARAELYRADDLAPDLPIVRDAHATVDGRLSAGAKAAELAARAKTILASDPVEADRLLAEAQSIAPAGADGEDEIVRLRREATLRVEADRSADRAEDAWTARDRERTVRELRGAQLGDRPVPKADAVRRRIEKELVAETPPADETALRASLEFAEDAGLHPGVVRALRDLLVTRLLAAARDLRETRRPATAALLELEAKRLRGDVKTPALDGIASAATVTVLVAPFEDATGGRVDGMRLARALRERLTIDSLGGGLPLRALDDSDEARRKYPDAARLTGRITAARANEGRVGREEKKVSWQTGTTRRPNPDFTALVAKIDAASSALRAAEDARKDAAAWLEAVQGMGFVNGRSDPRQGAVEYQSKLAAAQVRLGRAEEALTRARDAEFTIRQEAAATPRDLEEPVFSEHVMTVTTLIKTATVTAHVELVSGGATLLSQDVTGSVQHRETVSDGFAPAGLAPDPDDTPDDAAMAEKAADRFAAAAVGRVRVAAEDAALPHLVKAREDEAAGRRDEAAESYAMYLLSTPDVTSPQRADAARALAELLGVHVALRALPRKEEP